MKEGQRSVSFVVCVERFALMKSAYFMTAVTLHKGYDLEHTFNKRQANIFLTVQLILTLLVC